MSDAEKELAEVLEIKIIQHIAWLHLYAEGASKADWRDMRLRAMRQADNLMFDAKEYFTIMNAALNLSPKPLKP